MSWIQGASNSVNGGQPTVTLTVNAGDALLVAIGLYSSSAVGGLLRDLTITDSKSNIYAFAGCTPVQVSVAGAASQIAVFIATNCAAGSTNITASSPMIGGDIPYQVAMTVDEYSNVAAVRPIDGINFNSTAYGAMLSTVASGSIQVNGTEVVYSAAFADVMSATFTPSVGYTQRQLQNGSPGDVSLASFDETLTGGVTSNTVTTSSSPTSMHVIVLGLSAVSVTSPVAQIGYGVWNSVSGPGLYVPFPFPNTVGNLMVCIGRVFERANIGITDSLGNTWTVVAVDSPESGSLFAGYCVSAKAGDNTLTIIGSSGGDDNSWTVFAMEYNIQQAAFIAFSDGFTTPGASVDTGYVAATGPAFLVSGMVAVVNSGNFTSPAKVTSGPGTWRQQLSDSGLFTTQVASLTIADQKATIAGSYHNVFAPGTSVDNLFAVILGFSIPSGGGGGGGGGACQSLTGCTQLQNFEVTRDLDADWDDRSTFFITQDVPFPFTLRGLVWREDFNND